MAKSKSSGKKLNRILITGGAGFIGSNLTLTLQARYPEADITVLDDFRSGDYKNLEGFRGDVVAKDVSRMNMSEQFQGVKFDAIFHLASVTDTTNYDQLYQNHDNIEGFRKILDFAKTTKTPVVYASSAATYGMASGVNRETDPAKPANVYAFSKVILDNVARKYSKNYKFKVVGVRYFNVYGPRESHKGVPASMIWHLSQQMKAGKNPRIFKHGEQLRDFIYVKDAVQNTILALSSPKMHAVYNTGSGQARSFNDLISILNKVLGMNKTTDYIDNPYKHYQNHTEADLSLSKKDLKFSPQFTLEKGVEDYMNWLRSRG